jgi:hypothetical protein
MRSFKLLLTGAVGITLAASSFASDAYAFQLHPVGGWARPLPYGPTRPGVSLGYRNVMGVRMAPSPTAQHFARLSQSPGSVGRFGNYSNRLSQSPVGRNFGNYSNSQPSQLQQQHQRWLQQNQEQRMDDYARMRGAQDDAARISSLCRNSNQPSCDAYRSDGTYRYGDRGPLNY